MGKINNKLLCLSSLLLGFYLMSNVLPFPGFIDEVFITALAFPFFSKRLRVRITLAVQGIGLMIYFQRVAMVFMKYGDMVTQMVSNRLEFGSILGGSEVSLLPDSVVNIGSQVVDGLGVFGQVPVILQALFPVEAFVVEFLYHGVQGLVVIAFVVLYLIIGPGLIIIGWTAPYSIYLIIDKLGFYRLVERNTSGVINFKTPWEEK